MPSAYKNARGHDVVRAWCSDTLLRADFPLTSATVDTTAGQVQVTCAGTGSSRVPGTASNAAIAMPWPRAPSARWATTIVDLPGQPGLSDPHRPRWARLAWYGPVVDEVLTSMQAENVVLLGNSLGAACSGCSSRSANSHLSPKWNG